MAITVMGEAPKIAAKIQDQVRVVYDIGARVGEWTKRYEPVFPDAHFYLFDVVQKAETVGPRQTWHEGALSAPGVNEVNFYHKTGKGDGGDSYYKDITPMWAGIDPERVPAHTLDSLDLPEPQVMKLDTQGSEVDILKGATKALASTLMIQIEMPVVPLNQKAPTFDAYMNILTRHDFVPLALEELHYWGEGLCQIDLVFVAKRILRDVR